MATRKNMSAHNTPHTIYQLFIDSCKKHANRQAIYIQGTSYTYTQFLSIISEIKRQINDSTNDSKLIGLYTNEHVNTYASIWAVMSTGAAYVPINKKHPADRAAGIIREAGIKILLYAEESEALSELQEKLKGEVEFIKTNTITNGELDYTFSDIKGEDLIYLLFTSGSTGKPKGVPISHHNVMALAQVHLLEPKYDFNAEDRFIQMFELTFDFSVLPTLLPFCAGASVYIVPQEGIMYLEVLQILMDHQITKAYMVPSVINYLQPYYEQINLPDLKWSLFCGEALYEKSASGWLKCMPNGKIINTYGPTEATVFMTEYFWNENTSEAFNGVIGIGKALNKMGTMIVDENYKEVPQGEKGELEIYGPQTSTHYWKDEEKTKASFINIEHRNYKGLAYRTGDLVFENDKGNILYCGRIDHQIKINGYRVELGEIEFHAKKFCEGKNLAAFTIKNKIGATSIYMAIEKLEEDSNKLVEYLKENLPAYMIPEKIFSIKQLPLSLSGKTDRNALSSLFQEK
ncbi:MAG: AMP-binding protein [Flavobacteriales bacterium]